MGMEKCFTSVKFWSIVILWGRDVLSMLRRGVE